MSRNYTKGIKFKYFVINIKQEMLHINHILRSIIGLTTASILVKLLDKSIEKMCEYHDCRTLEEEEDEESAN